LSISLVVLQVANIDTLTQTKKPPFHKIQFEPSCVCGTFILGLALSTYPGYFLSTTLATLTPKHTSVSENNKWTSPWRLCNHRYSWDFYIFLRIVSVRHHSDQIPKSPPLFKQNWTKHWRLYSYTES